MLHGHNHYWGLLLKCTQLLCLFLICGYSWKLAHINTEFSSILSAGNFSTLSVMLALTSLGLGLLLSYFRWYLIMLYLNIPVNLTDLLYSAVQSDILGAITFGTTGADLSRCLLLIRFLPQSKSKILVSILLDRAMGICSLLLLGAIAILSDPLLKPSLFTLTTQPLGYLFWFMLIAGCFSVLALFLISLISGFTWLHQLTIRVPVLGHKIIAVILALNANSLRWRFFCLILLLSLSIHCFMASGIFLMGTALKLSIPPWQAHLVTYPLVTLTGIIPLPFGGIGLGEVSTDYLYRMIGDIYTVQIQTGTGVIAMLAVRISCFLLLALMSIALMIMKFKTTNKKAVQGM